MRLGILSDIHANLPALEAVLESISKAGVDETWCLGDVVGYGAHPDECAASVASECELALVGNHDLAVLGEIDIALLLAPPPRPRRAGPSGTRRTRRCASCAR